MRIIAGKFKGKKLFLPNDKKTRPLKDMVKESIFNLVQHSKKINIEIENSTVLDLFSGSGSFGIECISRGAKNVYFFENYSEALKLLRRNILALKENQKCKVLEENCFDYFKLNKNLNIKFDIVFMDPPYKEQKINEIIEKIIEKNFLTSNGVIIIHRHKKDTVKISEKLRIFENRTYGISRILFGN